MRGKKDEHARRIAAGRNGYGDRVPQTAACGQIATRKVAIAGTAREEPRLPAPQHLSQQLTVRSGIAAATVFRKANRIRGGRLPGRGTRQNLLRFVPLPEFSVIPTKFAGDVASTDSIACPTDVAVPSVLMMVL